MQTIKILHSQASDGNMSFRWGDPSEVMKNRIAFFEKNHIKIANGVNLVTQNASEIITATLNDAGKGMNGGESAIKGDGLITKENLALCLLTADCLPISFYDLKGQVIGIAHAGWRGTNEKIAQKMVEKFVNEFGSDPKDIQIEIGPGIKKESFVFENPVQKEMPEWQPHLKDLPNDQTSIDLFSYNRQQLINSGILENNITISPIDTRSDQNYFSHYRSVRNDESEGRFFTIIYLEDKNGE